MCTYLIISNVNIYMCIVCYTFICDVRIHEDAGNHLYTIYECICMSVLTKMFDNTCSIVSVGKIVHYMILKNEIVYFPLVCQSC